MNKILFSVMLILISMSSIAQVNGVGINTDTPQAALDIKSDNDDRNKVMRITGDFADSNNDDAVFFVGKSTQNQNQQMVYDLRRITKEDIANKIKSKIPTLNSITITNSEDRVYTKKYNSYPVNFDTEVINTNQKMFEFIKNENAIKILKEGEYNISAFVGFEELGNFENDLIVSVAKKKGDKFSNYKRNVISKSSGTTYSIKNTPGAGIGASFSFTNRFKAKDIIRLQVSKTTLDKNIKVKILKNSCNLTITRVN